MAIANITNNILTDSGVATSALQIALNGTGFVKIVGTTISYDNSTYYLASNPSAYIALTGLSATAPLAYNNTTGGFSISQAGVSGNGYLTSTDWNTFNSKMQGGGLTAGKVPFATGIASLGDTNLNYNGGFFGFGTAASTYRIDVSGDVNVTGNYYINGVAISTGGVTGTGTTNYLPKFTGASTIGNSAIYDNGGNIGIGTSTGIVRKLTIYSATADNQLLIAGAAPSVRLTDALTGAIYHATYGLATGTNDYITNAVAGDFCISAATGSNIIFGNNIVEAFRVFSNGNIGINTGSTNAGYKLDVNGTASATMFYVGTSTPSDASLRVELTSGYAIKVTRTGLDRFWVDSDGAGYLKAAAWTYGSDLRLKENIKDVVNGIDTILKLKPKHFDYIDGVKNNLGFIAQDVQKVIPEAVSITDKNTGYLGLKTEFIIPYLVKAIQEQQAQINELKQLINK